MRILHRKITGIFASVKLSKDRESIGLSYIPIQVLAYLMELFSTLLAEVLLGVVFFIEYTNATAVLPYLTAIALNEPACAVFRYGV